MIEIFRLITMSNDLETEVLITIGMVIIGIVAIKIQIAHETVQTVAFIPATPIDITTTEMVQVVK